MVAILIFSLHLQLFPGLPSVIAPDYPWPALFLLSFNRSERRRLLIQFASLQKIVVAFADHLLLGILGNQQSARVQLCTPFFH